MASEIKTKWPTPDFPEFILRHLPIGLLTVDADLRITSFNPGAEQITGYNREEVLGRYCGEVLQGGQCQRSCPLRTVLNREKESVSLETTILIKSGQTLPVRLRTAAMFNRDGKMIGALEAFSDISEIKQYERDRTQTLSIFAHDMKTPLIAISGFVGRLLEGKAGDLNDGQKKYLEVIQAEVEQITALALDFLDVARLGHEGAALVWDEVSLEDIIRDTAVEYEQKADVKGMIFKAEIEPDLPHIKGDAHRIRRAVTNLLDNALKYSEQGEVRLVLRRKDAESLEIRVLDQGPGLSEEDIKTIFDSFQRGSAAHGKEGTGLGLTAVKRIAEAHYGSVFAGNRDEGGAEFIIILPLQNR
jgi:PAS domain S-box-containing protein